MRRLPRNRRTCVVPESAAARRKKSPSFARIGRLKPAPPKHKDQLPKGRFEKPPRGVGSEPGDRQDWQRISGKMRRKSMPVLSVPGALVGGDEVSMAVFHELSRAEGPSQQGRKSTGMAGLRPALEFLHFAGKFHGHQPRRARAAHGASHGNKNASARSPGGAKEPFHGDSPIAGHEGPSYAPTGLARLWAGPTGLTPWAIF